MALKTSDINDFVKRTLILEKKKKSAKKTAAKDADKKTERQDGVQPAGFMKSDSHDLSKPLGDLNVYARQGAANFGPFTAIPVSGDTVKMEENNKSAWNKLNIMEVDNNSKWANVARLSEAPAPDSMPIDSYYSVDGSDVVGNTPSKPSPRGSDPKEMDKRTSKQSAMYNMEDNVILALKKFKRSGGEGADQLLKMAEDLLKKINETK